MNKMHRFRFSTRMRSAIRAFAFHWYILQRPMILFEDSKGPAQTVRMRRLVWAFAVSIWPNKPFRIARPISRPNLRIQEVSFSATIHLSDFIYCVLVYLMSKVNRFFLAISGKMSLSAFCYHYQVWILFNFQRVKTAKKKTTTKKKNNNKKQLSHILTDYIQCGNFMSKYSWNRLVKTTIYNKVENLWTEKISNDRSLRAFYQIHDKYERCAFLGIP